MALAFLMKKLDEKSRSSEHQLGLKGQIPNLLASMPVAVRGCVQPEEPELPE